MHRAYWVLVDVSCVIPRKTPYGLGQAPVKLSFFAMYKGLVVSPVLLSGGTRAAELWAGPMLQNYSDLAVNCGPATTVTDFPDSILPICSPSSTDKLGKGWRAHSFRCFALYKGQFLCHSSLLRSFCCAEPEEHWLLFSLELHWSCIRDAGWELQ